MVKRTIEGYISKQIKLWPVTIITGARQIGKSTLCGVFQKKYGFNYVSLDNIDKRKSAIADPKFFIETHNLPLIIDEIQYAPELFEAIEEIVNKRRFDQNNPNGLFILTGSHNYKLMKGVTQSLAGRACIIEMTGLSQNEINGIEEVPFIPNLVIAKERQNNYYSDINSIFERIIRGSYPELLMNNDLDNETYYRSYISSYIDRDVSEIINIKDKLKFHNFMAYVASITGQELNLESISKSIGISNPTVKEWLSILESSGLIFLLQPYNESSIVKRIIKRPKLYFTDTGLACHLIKIHDAKTLAACFFAGSFMETYMINEIRKTYINNGIAFDFYYYRDTNQNEIDLIILRNGILYMIEFKSGISFNMSDVKAFKQLKDTSYQIGDSCIIALNKEAYFLNNKIFVIPIQCI